MKKLSIDMLSGFKWTSFYSVISGLLNGIMLLALGILLSPQELGNRAVVTLLITAAMMVTQFGISQALIQKQKILNKDLNSVFIFNLTLGLLLFAITYLFSEEIALFYSSESLTLLIQVTSLIFILDSIPLVFKATLEKRLKFKPLAIMEIIKITLSSSTTIILALYGLGAWSFVIGKLFGSISNIIYFCIYIRKDTFWSPRLQFSLSSFISFAKFGIYVIGTSITNFTSKNLDEILIGRFLGVELLGIYNLAKQAIDQMTQVIAMSIRKVTYPTFCKLVLGVKSEFADTYMKLSKVVSSFASPLFISIVLIAPALINNILSGTSWVEAITLIQIFSVKSLFDILSSGFATSSLYAYDKPKAVFYIEMCLLPIRVILLIIAAQISLLAVALSFLTFVIIKVTILQIVVNKILELKFKRYINNIKGPLIAIFVSSGIVFATIKQLDIYYLLEVLLTLILLIVIYFLILKIFYKDVFHKMLNVKNILFKIKN